MAEQLPPNAAHSTLAADIDDAVTTLTVAAGEGSLFGSLFPLRIAWKDTPEIMTLTGRATDVLTVGRAQEGTGAVPHLTGEELAAVLTNAGVQALLDSGSPLMQIAQLIVSGADASLLDIASIPAGYSELVVVVNGRTDQSSTYSLVYARFNNDSGSNYDDQTVLGTDTAAAAGGDLGTSGALIGILPGDNAPANYGGAFEAKIPDYAGTTFTKVFVSPGASFGSSSGLSGNVFTFVRGGHWRSTAAINRIQLQIQAGSPAKFKIGTKMTLYGLL